MKTRVTQAALAQLADLGLSVADLDIILCFGRRIEHDNVTFFIFDQDLTPVASNKLNCLQGVTIRVFEGKITDIYRDQGPDPANTLSGETD
jgi:hypothetical protein